MPDTTLSAKPAAWSLIMFNQVIPRLRPKYFGFGRAWIVRTGTTNRIPSTLATNPPPHSRANGINAWASTRAELAAARVSSRT